MRRLSYIVELVLLLDSADLFLKQYANLLAARLLEDSKSDQESEKALLKKLSEAFGQNSVSSMLRMVRESEEVWVEERAGVALRVQVGTAGAWPWVAVSGWEVPESLWSCAREF